MTTTTTIKNTNNRSLNDFESTEDLERALTFGMIGTSEDEYIMAKSSDGDGGGGCVDWLLTNCDAETTLPQSLQQELLRLEVLRSYYILDAERESAFERLTALASRLFRVPYAIVSLVDLGRQWFMSNRGLGDLRETPRRHSFCAHAIISKDDLLVVPDATKDVRFRDNPLVTGTPNIRFYAGAPLITRQGGYKLGCLCIIDTKPRPEGLNLEEKQNLREMADMVIECLETRREKKRTASREPSQMIATLAHDLLTPLTGIELSLSLLHEDRKLREELTTHHKELLETAIKCSSVMSRVCQSAIESYRSAQIDDTTTTSFSASRGGFRDMGESTIDMRSFVDNINTIMAALPMSVAIHVDLDPSVPAEVVGDDLKIFRSAVNYLTMACSRTEKGSVVLRIYAKQTIGPQKELVFKVEDTGPNIEVEKYNGLFESVQPQDGICGGNQLHPGLNPCAASVSQDDFGLRLISVASQIRSIGGQFGYHPRATADDGTFVVRADGEATTGSVFWFSIPLVTPTESGNSLEQRKKEDSDAPPSRTLRTPNRVGTTEPVGAIKKRKPELKLPSSPSVAADGNSHTRKRRALVIEDSVVVRKSLCRALSRLGFETVQAINGLEGFTELQSDFFDIVLCDFLMPVMDGPDCIQQYRQWEETHHPWWRQHIVGISAHANETDVEKGLRAGMDEFKPKPITFEVLRKLMTSERVCQATSALDKLELDMNHGIRDRKKQKILTGCGKIKTNNHKDCACLVAIGSNGMPDSAIDAIRNTGWKIVMVHDGELALSLLKMRYWAAVFVDDELPLLSGRRCMMRFREWEKQNRTNKQKNVVFLRSSLSSPSNETTSSSQTIEVGFDGVIRKPLLLNDLTNFLSLDKVGGSD